MLRRSWVQALEVSDHEVATYIPTTFDIHIAEAILAGCFTTADICAFTGHRPDTVWKSLRNPVAGAWMSRQLQSHVQKRLGMVLASMFARAVSGDVGAARLVLDRFQQIQSISHVVQHKGLDVTKLSDNDLELVLQGKIQETGAIIDVPCLPAEVAQKEPECSGPSSTAGEGETENACVSEAGRPVSALPGLESCDPPDRPHQQRREAGSEAESGPPGKSLDTDISRGTEG